MNSDKEILFPVRNISRLSTKAKGLECVQRELKRCELNPVDFPGVSNANVVAGPGQDKDQGRLNIPNERCERQARYNNSIGPVNFGPPNIS